MRSIMLTCFQSSLHFALERLQFMLPSSCALCGADGVQNLCNACSTQYFEVHPARCTQCASRLQATADRNVRICGACLKQPPPFEATVVAADYAAPVDQLVLALKFGGSLAMAPTMASLLHAAVRRSTTDLPDVLFPVPLAQARLAGRGFNQSLEIARYLAPAMGIMVEAQWVIRVRETLAQSLLPLKERHDNVRQAFTLDGEVIERIRGRHIGLVDDVMTTGATLTELAGVLKRFGAARITNLVFARAQ